MKKLLCILLAALLLLAMAACSGTPEPAPEANAPENTAPETTTPDTEPEATEPEDTAPDASGTGSEDTSAESAAAKKHVVEGYDAATLTEVVATYGDHELTNLDLNYYYWLAFSSFYSSYSSYIAYLIDFGIPLSEQNYSDDVSWQKYFIDYAIFSWKSIMGYCDEAEKAGFDMPAEYAAMFETLEADMAASAAESGYDTLDSYLKDNYGPDAAYDTFYDFYWDYYLGVNYYSTIYSDFTAAHANDEPIKMVNVRHILVEPEDSASDESWSAAETKANELYETWKADGTEDGFAALATENSTDTGSSENGGLYEDVYPGQMVDAFNDWCFDAARKSGDTGVVKTDYGYHIMYYVGLGGDYADTATYYATQDTNEWVAETFAGYSETDKSENAKIYVDFGA